MGARCARTFLNTLLNALFNSLAIGALAAIGASSDAPYARACNYY
jgi:hypothetical protein